MKEEIKDNRCVFLCGTHLEQCCLPHPHGKDDCICSPTCADKYWLANALANGLTADPEAPENQSPDFKDGFATGLTEEKTKRGQESAIAVEYHRRGDVADEGFKTWKRGYWAGVFTRLQNQVFN